MRDATLMPNPKTLPVRSPKYRKFIRTHPCLISDMDCGGPVECAHINVDGGTMGGKSSDLFCVPLCNSHHTGNLGIHRIGEKTFWSFHCINPMREALKLINEYVSNWGRF